MDTDAGEQGHTLVTFIQEFKKEENKENFPHNGESLNMYTISQMIHLGFIWEK